MAHTNELWIDKMAISTNHIHTYYCISLIANVWLIIYESCLDKTSGRLSMADIWLIISHVAISSIGQITFTHIITEECPCNNQVTPCSLAAFCQRLQRGIVYCINIWHFGNQSACKVGICITGVISSHASFKMHVGISSLPHVYISLAIKAENGWGDDHL